MHVSNSGSTRCGRQLPFARVPQKRKGRGGAAPNGEEHAVFEAPERVRFARVTQKFFAKQYNALPLRT